MSKAVPLRLELFGGPVLKRGGAAVSVSPYQAALLTVLFTEGRERLPRSKVQRLLWGSAEDSSVRHSLSQLVYQINRKVGVRLMEIEGTSIRLHGGVVECDLDQFEELIRRPDFASAGDLVSRGFLSAFPKLPTEAFDDWMGLRKLSVRARLREKALASWASAEAVQDWGAGRAAAEVLLMLDPRDETILRRVMKARAMGGLVREAEAVYLSFADRLGEQGEWTPHPDTADLLSSVRATYNRADAPQDISVPPRLEVPLCGRDEELAYLTRSVFQDRSAGSPTTVSVSGAAGLGKTRLVEEAIQGARFRGYQVLRARPAELERNIPLNPLLEALNQPWIGPVLRGLENPWRSVLLGLMPQFHEGPGPLPEVPYVQPGSLPRRTYEAFFRLFRAVSETSKTLLFIDDLQWADETSAAVLQFMHRRWQAGELTLILTYRQEELQGDQPLARFLGELEGDPQAVGIRLSELDPDSATALAESVAPDRLSDVALGEIVALAGGNPFFVIELAADYLADRMPELSTDGVPVPMSVRQMIARRMQGLDSVAKQVVSALSVFAHPASLPRLNRMTGIAREACVEGLEILQDLRLVDWVDGGVRCRHDIVRCAVYEDMGQARRALLHGRIAEMLEAESDDPPKDQLALHYYRAGESDLALKYALEAADEAEVSGSNSEGIRYTEMALELTRDAGRRIVLSRRLAMLHHQDRDLVAAERWLRLAVMEVDSDDDRETWLTLASRLVEVEAETGAADSGTALLRLSRLENDAVSGDHIRSVVEIAEKRLKILDRIGDTKAIEPLFAGVEPYLEGASPLIACAIHCLLALKVYFGDVDEALSHARNAMALIYEHGLPELRLRAYARQILLLGHMARLHSEEGERTIREALEWSENSGDVLGRYLIRTNVATWYLDTGDLDRARACYARMNVDAARSKAHRPRLELAVNMGDLAVHEGDFDAALAQYRRASDLLGGAAPHYVVDLVRAGVGLCYLKLGRLRAAKDYGELIGRPTKIWQNDQAIVIRFLAELAAVCGDWNGADLLFQEHEASTEDRLPVLWIKLRLARVRLRRRSPSANEAPRLTQEGRDVAAGLGLTLRLAEFERLASVQ